MTNDSGSIPLRERILSTLQLKRAVRLAWEAAPRWAVINCLLIAVQGVMPLLALYTMKRILDAIPQSLSLPVTTHRFQPVLVWILLAGGVAFITLVTRLLSEYASEAQSMQVTDHVSDILHAQSITVDLEYYEDPAYYDTLHRAQQEAPYRPTRIVNELVQIAQNSIALIGILSLMISFNWLLTLILMLSVLPNTLLRFSHSRYFFRFEQAQTAIERRSWFYHTILTYNAYAKEVRLLNIGNLFRERFRASRNQLRTGRLNLAKRRIIIDLVAQGFSIVALFGGLAWIAWETVQGKILVSDLVIYYLAFQNGTGFTQAILRALAGLYEDNLFLTNLYRFLDLSPRIRAPQRPQPVPDPKPGLIQFEHVGFMYSSRKQPTLHDVNITIQPGQVVALVGENGSGKTTLIKLLCRLYDPTEGSIRINDVDIRELDPLQWRREMSIIFQDYAHYALTAADNIWLGDVETSADLQQIDAAAKRAGADYVIKRLPHAYDTMLGSWFQEGQELSTGEWQKIALARAFWRDAHLLILDEPTSSLDPLAEQELFHRLRKLLDNRSAILISHRFSTVQLADYIYVLDNGCVIEHGCHNDLITQKGHYARLYNAQAKFYKNL